MRREVNQRAAVPVLTDCSSADCGCFACLIHKCQATFGWTQTAANPLPHTCLWFLCKAWIAKSSWRCRCCPLIAHVCHLFLILYLNSSRTTFVFFLITFLYFLERHLRTCEMSLVLRWGSGEGGHNLTLRESHTSPWWARSEVQTIISQPSLNVLAAETSFMAPPQRLRLNFYVLLVHVNVCLSFVWTLRMIRQQVGLLWKRFSERRLFFQRQLEHIFLIIIILPDAVWGLVTRVDGTSSGPVLFLSGTWHTTVFSVMKTLQK